MRADPVVLRARNFTRRPVHSAFFIVIRMLDIAAVVDILKGVGAAGNWRH
jgi:hypothetical protein